MPKLCTFFTFRPVGWLGQLGWLDHKNRIGYEVPYSCSTSRQISTKSVKAWKSYPIFKICNNNDNDTHQPWIIFRVGMIFCRGQKDSMSHKTNPSTLVRWKETPSEALKAYIPNSNPPFLDNTLTSHIIDACFYTFWLDHHRQTDGRMGKQSLLYSPHLKMPISWPLIQFLQNISCKWSVMPVIWNGSTRQTTKQQTLRPKKAPWIGIPIALLLMEDQLLPMYNLPF